MPANRAPRIVRRAVPSPLLTAALCAGVLLLAAALAPVAVAHTSPPRYSLSIVEGVTTDPEHGIEHISAGIENEQALVRVLLVHGGLVVAQSTGEHPGDGVWLSRVPQVGDLVELEAPLGRLIARTVYDGLPSMDPTVCAGSKNFSGQRSSNNTVEGEYFSLSSFDWYTHKNAGQAQVTTLAGSAFGGNFLAPLALGQTVAAREQLETQLATGGVFTYSSETVRPVGACPAPPPPPPPPPPVAPGLQATIAHLLGITVRNLLRHGFSDRVTVNQAATVTQDLYMENGVLPAFASARRHHRRPPAVLLARGSVVAHAAGTVTVKLKLLPRARARLRSAHRVHVVLLTTVHTTAGAKLNLPRRQLTVR